MGGYAGGNSLIPRWWSQYDTPNIKVIKYICMTWRFSRQKPNYGSYALCISVLQALNGKSCYLKCLSVCFLQDREGGGEGVFSVILRHPCGGGERRFFFCLFPSPSRRPKRNGWVVRLGLGRPLFGPGMPVRPSHSCERKGGEGGGGGQCQK